MDGVAEPGRRLCVDAGLEFAEVVREFGVGQHVFDGVGGSAEKDPQCGAARRLDEVAMVEDEGEGIANHGEVGEEVFLSAGGEADGRLELFDVVEGVFDEFEEMRGVVDRAASAGAIALVVVMGGHGEKKVILRRGSVLEGGVEFLAGLMCREEKAH